MTTLNKLIVIWGAAIIIYIAVANRAGTSAGLSGITNLVTSSTRALQGR